MSVRNENLKKNLIDESYFNTSNMKEDTQADLKYNTLREGVWTSLKREFVKIFNKTQFVIVPRCSAGSSKELRNWDLWGPLIFTMLLSYFMTKSGDQNEMTVTFCMVFILMWVGGTIITINSMLLGSKITVCQSLCVLGYCLFPILVASILIEYLSFMMTVLIRLLTGLGAFLWASTSSIAFMGDIVGEDKKGLSVYPIYLFYFAFTCYLLL